MYLFIVIVPGCWQPVCARGLTSGQWRPGVNSWVVFILRTERQTGLASPRWLLGCFLTPFSHLLPVTFQMASVLHEVQVFCFWVYQVRHHITVCQSSCFYSVCAWLKSVFLLYIKMWLWTAVEGCLEGGFAYLVSYGLSFHFPIPNPVNDQAPVGLVVKS